MQRFKNILCVIETDQSDELSLERAVQLADNNQANLTLAAVAPTLTTGLGLADGAALAAELQTAVVEDTGRHLDEVVRPYRKARRSITTRVLAGTPFLEIIREVRRQGHDLLIKLPERQDWLDRLFGSNDMHLLRKCPCPVWLIKPSGPRTYRQILAAVDVGYDLPGEEQASMSRLNQQILEIASSLAVSDFASLHIVHVWDAVGESALRVGFLSSPEEKISQYVDLTRRQHELGLNQLMAEVARGPAAKAIEYLKPDIRLVKGWARKEIPVVARDIQADVVVMGTVARTGVSGFIMGNTAETILNQLDCSVLAIKPAGFETPVR